MKQFLKNNYLYLILFCVFLLFNLFCSVLTLDEVWSYGFSYNLYHGAIPYKDFNMVITPFYPFFMSLPMFIFGDNLIIFHIMNALLVTVSIKLLFTLLDRKAWLVLPFFLFPLNITFPNYNFFLFLLFLVLLVMEEKKESDYWIGVILSLVFLTKQSVGFVLLFSVLFYLPNYKKIGKRLIGFIVPILFTMLVLFVLGCIPEFIDYCVLGLFDFGSGNGKVFSPIFFLTIICIGIIIYLFFKKKKINILYILLFSSLCIPLFDFYHFQLFLLGGIVVYLMNSIHTFKRAPLIGITLGLGLICTYFFHMSWDGYYPNDISHFEYRYLTKEHITQTKNTLNLMKKYHNKVIFVGPNGYYYKIILNKKMNSLDLINTGNWGYHGSDKLLKKVKSLDKDYVFFVSGDEFGLGKQTDQQLIAYIIEKGIKIEEEYSYSVYRLE